ncbi:MAG: integration host factor subunit alpha [Pseudomonadota bacterium]
MAGKTVTRADLADAVYRMEILRRESASEEPLSRDECAQLVEAVLNEVADALVETGVVKLSSFGAFSVREKSARMGRNPKTGEEALITPRRVLSFRASHVLKAAVNQDLAGAELAEDVAPAKQAG